MQLSDIQRDAVSKAFEARAQTKTLSPLYIKLVFDILIKWNSYSEDISIPSTVTACMDQLFTNLEKTHGKFCVMLKLRPSHLQDMRDWLDQFALSFNRTWTSNIAYALACLD